MRSYHLLVASAAFVAASPAPQGLAFDQLDAITNSVPQGPKVGVEAPVVAQADVYDAKAAINAAAAKVAGPAQAQQAKRDLNARSPTFWNWFPQAQTYNKPQPQPQYGNNSPPPAPNPVYGGGPGAGPTPSKNAPPPSGPAPTPAPTPGNALPPQGASSTNQAPSSCTPVSWTNTWAFTADPACATQIEVGTYCGFINPLDPCAAQPNAYAPNTTPDTVDAFKNNPVYHKMATSAKTPDGWESAFTDLSGSVTGSGYLGYFEMTSYDPLTCAKKCDDTKTCTGFNVFVERDPKWNPEQCSCDKADSVARFKCTLWGQDVTKESATNVGQTQSGFEVIIVASNGYNKKAYTPPPPPSCSKPQSCGRKLVNKQPYCMGQITIPGPFNPDLCAAYAQKQNEVNRKSGIIAQWMSLFGFNKGGCVQFQAAYLEKNGIGFGTHCRLYTQKFTSINADLDISVSSQNKWGCQKSFLFDLDVNASFNWGRRA
ncbi:hypothetical protein yc1106_02334 [Curvularia clavata]|uniref:Uncharacterized protein n=1 Tax=Curvularia clavata TaxID=95742 RepID=A0A9Q8Z3L1_CURCL|nr:hypothetical protein yc1106_02334 [Curvularia clavata]